MYRMDKLTTVLHTALQRIPSSTVYSPEQWNAISVLVGNIIVVMTCPTKHYFKIREDNHRSRRQEEVNIKS